MPPVGETDSDFPEVTEGRESFGEFLRRHREASGKTLDGISRATRIAKRYLQAFEGNQTEYYPEEAFARGFLKVYAREVGLDVDDTIARYEQFKRSLIPTQIKEIKKPAPKLPLAFDGSILKHQRSLIVMIVVGVALALLVSLGLWIFSPDRSPQVEKVVVEETAESGEEAVEDLGTQVPAVQPTQLAAPVRPSILKVTAVKNSKLTIRIDESPAEEMALKAGESRTFNIFREIEIKSLDRTAFQFQYNGKPLDIAGPVIKLFNRHLFSKP